MKLTVVLAVFIAILVLACSSAETIPSTVAPAAKSQSTTAPQPTTPPTSVPTSTPTAVPSATPEPMATPTPVLTRTLKPMATPTPVLTRTLKPTSTPIPIPPTSAVEMLSRVVVYAASDLTEDQITKTKKWFDVGASAWLTPDSVGAANFYPVYLVILGKDMDAGIELEDELCSYLQKQHPVNYRNTKCTRQKGPNGRGLITGNVDSGNACICSNHNQTGYQLMIVGTGFWESEHYAGNVLHEVFHIYQLASVTEQNPQEFRKRLGSISGDTSSQKVWWQEGTAEYMGRKLYSEQPEASNDYFKTNLMTYFDRSYRNIERFQKDGSPVIDAYFNAGIKLYNLNFEQDETFGYTYEQLGRRIGAWFVAYLISNVGEARIMEFYENLDELGFDEAFISYFGKPYREYIEEYESFLQRSPEEILAILE